MPIKTNLADMFAKIQEANSNTPKRVAVTPGTYNVKCIGAEVKKSLKGKQMAMLTFTVTSDGECRGGTTKQYTTIENFDEANPWKYATLVSVLNAYNVNIDQVCTVSDTMEEALAMATTKLAKKCEKSNPSVSITLTRKETGTAPDGKPIYRDYYSFGKNADVASEANEANTEDSFFKELES